jgi:broad specificity phosphatase PhoE/CTP:molybdopterin cytidylyltransferase MocA
MDRKISAIILAAGLSSRMGRLKALMDIGGEKAILRLIDANIKAGITDIVVVLGYRSIDILKYTGHFRNVKCVVNGAYMSGMFSSVQKGVSKIDPESEGFMLMPVDIPLIKPNTIREMAESFFQGDCDILLPYFGEKKGHPPVISVKCIPDILAGSPANGMRGIMDSGKWTKRRLQTVDEGILHEMDTMDQYLDMLEYWSGSYVPNRNECAEIWKRCSVSEDIIKHQEAVACCALRLGKNLSEKGEALDMRLLEAACLLHDIRKSERNHPQRAGEFLEGLGYGKLGDIVSEHMDLLELDEARISEKELLYLADKLVKGSEEVGIEARFRSMLNNPDEQIRKRAEGRYSDSLAILRKVKRKGELRNVYIVRHAEVEKPAVKTYIGITDLSLSCDGISRAGELREKFSKLDIEAVYCSSLVRARDTAGIIAEGCGKVPVVRPEFNEIDMGEWEGRSFDEVKAEYPDEFTARGLDLLNYRVPGGESFLDVQARAMRALEDILASTTGDLVIVTHSGVKRSMLASLEGVSIRDFFSRSFDYCSVDVVTLNV